MALLKRAFPDQALALPVGPLGVLFGNGRDARHGAVAPFPAQPPQEPPLQQLGVEPVGLGPAMFPRYGDTRGMDHMRLHPTRPQPARQPEAIAAGFEGQRNPRDLAAGLDRLVAPAMQQAKQPFCTRLQLLAWLALNAGKHTGNQPTRLAHLDDGNDRAILVQGDEGPAQVVRLGHQGTPSVGYSDDGAISSPAYREGLIAVLVPDEADVRRDGGGFSMSVSCTLAFGSGGRAPVVRQRMESPAR